MTAAAVLAFVALLAPRQVVAQVVPLAPAPAAPASPNPPAGSLSASIDVARGSLDAEEVRRALEVELGVRVELADPGGPSPRLELSVDERGRARAVVRNDRGERVERVVELPKDRTRATESVAWLVGNLARDEAAELLRTLEKTQSETPTTAVAGAQQEAPATPPVDTAVPAPTETPAIPPPLPPPAQPKPAATVPRERRSPVFNLTLVHPITLVPRTEERTLRFELGLVYSRVGTLKGVAQTLGAVRVEHEMNGVALALGFVRAPLARGALIAAGATIADHVTGAQASVFANVAGSVDGGQVGLVNVAGKVRGVQLGLVNVADEIDGFSLGLVSVAKNTRVSALAWASNTEVANASLKVVTGYSYTQYGVGVRTNPTEYVLEAGLGAHFVTGPLFLEPGVHVQDDLSTPTEKHLALLYRGALGWTISPAFGVFAGGGVRHHVPNSEIKPVYFAGISLF
jgi:hypothetical protein